MGLLYHGFAVGQQVFRIVTNCYNLTRWFTNLSANKSTHTVVGLETKGLGAVSRLKSTHMPWHPPTRGLFKENPKTLWVPTHSNRP
jgi:hypothetical protein